MKNYSIKIITLIISLLVMTGVVYAADVTISTGSSTIEKGQTTAVTVSLSSGSTIGAYEFVIKYDASVIEYVKSANDEAFCNGGNGVLKIVDSPMAKSAKYTIRFKGKKAGKSALKIEYAAGNILDGSYGNMKVKTSAGTITVNNPRETSKDSSLKMLKVGQGELSPAFAAGTLEYSISTVSADVKSLTISATPNSAYAKVNISGNELKPGENVVSVIVTAENGDRRVYKIKVNVLEATPSPTPTPTCTPTPGVTINASRYELENGKLTVGNESLTILDKITVNKPEGFEDTVLEIGDFTIGAYKLNDGNLTLIQLSDGLLYVYEKGDSTVYPYVTYTTLVRNYHIVEAPKDKIPEGYTLTGFEYNGAVYPAYCTKASDEFLLVYLSEGKWYKFDIIDNTVQRYDESDKKVIIATPTPGEQSVTEAEPDIATPANGTAVSKEAGKDKLIRLAVMGVFFLIAIIFMILYFVERHRNLQILKEEEEDARYEAEKEINSRAKAGIPEEIGDVTGENNHASADNQTPAEEGSFKEQAGGQTVTDDMSEVTCCVQEEPSAETKEKASEVSGLEAQAEALARAVQELSDIQRASNDDRADDSITGEAVKNDDDGLEGMN